MKVKKSKRVARTVSWSFAILSLVALAGCGGNKMNKPEGPALSGEAIKTLIIGNTVDGAIGAQAFSYYYKSAVSVSGTIGMDGDDDSGTWNIKDNDIYCNEWISFFDGVQRCYKWYKTERGYILENVDSFRTQPLVVTGIREGNPLGF